MKLKAGGAVRVLLRGKLGRTFEATRTDFTHVEPFREVTTPTLDGERLKADVRMQKKPLIGADER